MFAGICLMTNISLAGQNVKALRKAAGLTKPHLADLLEISTSTLDAIERGVAEISSKSLVKLTSFFYMYTMDDIYKTEIVIDHDLRAKMAKIFSKSKPELSVHLEKRPTIVFAIDHKLLKTDFLDTFRTNDEIRQFFVKCGWDFNSSSITNALKRKSAVIEVKKHPEDYNVNLYRRKG